MKPQAIVLNRISSKDQESGHSLRAQLQNAQTKAVELDVEIVKVWSGVLSSNKGKNFKRKDLEEMLAYCKKNKRVKYVLVDMVNRLMREMKVMVYYMVRFDELGVKIIFCDPSQQHLNGNDQMSQLMLVIEGFKAEADNASRRETSISRMHSRIKEGYYLSHPHQGYIKSDTPGLHIPDPQRFKQLQAMCKHIIYDGYSVGQAVKMLNDSGYRTKANRKMTIDHFIDLFSDRYYCGIIDMQPEGWPKNVRGLHQPMLSVREHKILVDVFLKRNPRVRKKHNPEFPLSGILRHYECRDQGGYEKFTGINYNRGARPSGSQRPIKPVYDCRDCRKRIPREKTHESLDNHLARLELVPDKDTFKKALVKIWKQQRGSLTEQLRILQISKERYELELKQTAAAYAVEPEGVAKNALKSLMEDKAKEIANIDAEITRTRNVELESEDFVKFAVEFTENLRLNWWSLSHENKVRGEQILFNGKIFADNTASVHTPELSSIYRLGANKKDLGKVSLVNMVELPDTASGSASLSG